MTKDEIRRIRKALKTLVSGLHVRCARGTAWGWVDISGSGEFGEFTTEQHASLKSLGLQPGLNLALIAPDSRGYWLKKLEELAEAACPRSNATSA